MSGSTLPRNETFVLEAFETLFDKKVVATFGRLDVLVNNAGTAIPKKFEEATLEDLNRVIDITGSSGRRIIFNTARTLRRGGTALRSG